ncbi:MAG: tRNA(Ile)(2)-agmatinylcytidine synthase [Candidatus Nitrosoabyssus spongiisocia]|nr:MAG: tRNA(Ile)(2)-agmatinylcytidine synthase [Nitrosopumilaceae archaeon AB1(1)]
MKDGITVNIGFDDTDSTVGMCTTYLAFKMVDKLEKNKNTKIIELPNLLRFNPNIPWKTRGNGAVGLKIETRDLDWVKKTCISLIEKFSDVEHGANPAIIFHTGIITEKIKKFSRLSLYQLIPRRQAKRIVSESNIDTFHIGNGQGLIGSLGAVGYEFNDYTFEMLAYRKKSKFGTTRYISKDDVKNIQRFIPNTYNSFDLQADKIMISPHGPDPVFYGIRGEDTSSLLDASQLIKVKEDLDGYMIFKSNQGTGDHLRNEIEPDMIKPFTSGVISGEITSDPIQYNGGHAFFTVKTTKGDVDCAVYKETGMVQRVVLKLIKGDRVSLGGGIRRATKRYSNVLNVEFIDILHLQNKTTMKNPFCYTCNKSMKSKGRGQYFECSKCGKRSNTIHKINHKILRTVESKLYLPILSAQRHLTRPQERLGITNNTEIAINTIPWFRKFQ